jgi:hypothetical protein
MVRRISSVRSVEGNTPAGRLVVIRDGRTIEVGHEIEGSAGLTIPQGVTGFDGQMS